MPHSKTIHITTENSEIIYTDEFDVVICGYGGAGGCAALEASRNGAKVLILERASDGGGSTALSSCEMYLGGSGGTSLQKACGFEDSTQNMIDYIELAFKDKGDPEKIKLWNEVLGQVNLEMGSFFKNITADSFPRTTTPPFLFQILLE
jgi:ribulose 1,5-bisphosphate synthetase/thiazole synthase